MIQNMDKYIDAENDYLYIKGQRKEQEKFATYLIKQSNLPVEQIAKTVGVSVEFVQSIQQKLAEDK